MNENMEFPGISGEEIQWLQESFVQTIFARLEVSAGYLEIHLSIITLILLCSKLIKYYFNLSNYIHFFRKRKKTGAFPKKTKER